MNSETNGALDCQVDCRVKPGNDGRQAIGACKSIVMPGLDPGIQSV